MPRTAEQLEQIREHSRERILEAALRLFASRGYEATSVRMIAQGAGISQGLMYNYYESKEALLRAIFDRSTEDVQASFDQAGVGVKPQERMERLIHAAFVIVRENLPFWRLTYQIRMQPGVLEGLGASVRAWSESICRQLEELLRAMEAPSPEVEAHLLFAAIDGAAQHYAMDPEHYPLEEVTGALIRHFLPSEGGTRKRSEQENRS